MPTYRDADMLTQRDAEQGVGVSCSGVSGLVGCLK